MRKSIWRYLFISCMRKVLCLAGAPPLNKSAAKLFKRFYQTTLARIISNTKWKYCSIAFILMAANYGFTHRLTCKRKCYTLGNLITNTKKKYHGFDSKKKWKNIIQTKLLPSRWTPPPPPDRKERFLKMSHKSYQLVLCTWYHEYALFIGFNKIVMILASGSRAWALIGIFLASK